MAYSAADMLRHEQVTAFERQTRDYIAERLTPAQQGLLSEIIANSNPINWRRNRTRLALSAYGLIAELTYTHGYGATPRGYWVMARLEARDAALEERVRGAE